MSDTAEITKASFVFDVNFVVTIEKLDSDTNSFTVEWAGGPNYVDNFDLFYEADGTEHTWCDDDVQAQLLEAVRKYFTDERNGYERLVSSEARKRGN